MATTIITKAAPWRWQVRFLWPASRNPYRERCWSKLPSRSAALREGQAREAHLLALGSSATLASNAAVTEPDADPAAVVPTLHEFAPSFLSGWCAARQQKRSGVDSKNTRLRKHLLPAFGALRLDEITTERVATFQGALSKRYGRKTVANILVTLSKVLRVAVEWEKIPAMPCKIRPPKPGRASPTFYEQDRIRKLVNAAKGIDARTHALVLIGLHGALRRGEILGPRMVGREPRAPADHGASRGISKYVDTPKSGHGRVLELSAELTDALAALAATSTRTGRVFRQDSGKPALAKHLYAWSEAATKAAGIVRRKGERLHVMRHSACSALAALGAPTTSIQAFAGHERIQTTEKYMHLAPGAERAAVDLFDRAGTARARLDSEETIR